MSVETGAYCSIDDIRELLPARTYGNDTKPTDAGVISRIIGIANDINARLTNRGLDIPTVEGNENFDEPGGPCVKWR